jgi:anti-sigma factor RsiW
MDHLRFKSNHTAASYAADGLDAQTQEAFELHMMSCPECTGDVEIWRAMRNNLPRDKAQPAAPPVVHAPSLAPALRWRTAAAVAAVGLISGIGGWFVRSVQAPWLDSERMAFVSLPSVSRGFSECTPLQLQQQTKLVALRVPGAVPEEQLVAIDADGRDLIPDSYAVDIQGDSSWLVRLPAEAVRTSSVRFETRSVDGTAEPLGCVTGTPQ